MTQDEKFGMLTNQTNKRMQRFLNLKLQKYNITTEQWNVLLRLSKEPKINQKQLAKNVDKDQATLVRILDILEKKKLIKRQLSEEDRRAFLIHITDNGKEMVDELVPFMSDLFEQILSGISVEKLDIYIKVLTKINENIFRANEEEN